MVPEPCPSSSLKLSATAEPSPGLGSFTADVCLPAVSASAPSPRLGLAARSWAFPLMGWLTGLNSQWHPPHFRGPNDLHSRRTSGEVASLYWSSNQEKVTKNKRRPCPDAWLQVSLPVTFRVGTDPTPSPWDLEAPGTWGFSSVSHQHRNSSGQRWVPPA